MTISRAHTAAALEERTPRKPRKPIGRYPRTRPFEGLADLNWLQVALRLGEEAEGRDDGLDGFGPFTCAGRKRQ